MQSKLEELLKALGLPIGLAAVIVSLAMLLGLPLDQAFQLFAVLVGLPFFFGLIVDLLKQVGVVKDGTAGYWSAGFNLLGVIGVAVLLKYVPDIDIKTWDMQLLQILQGVVLLITWITQLFGTKRAHMFYSQGLDIKRFSFAD
jgi:hypothetical protein